MDVGGIRMKNHLKVFFSHFDIAFTSFLWLIGAALVIPDLDRPEIWLAIVVGMGSYSASEF